MKSEFVELGGKEYEVRELKTRKNAGFRKRLLDVLGNLVAPIAQVLDLKFDSAGLTKTIGAVTSSLGGSVTTLLDLMFEYSPELAADRKWIEEEAFDSEVMAAFIKVVKLVFPFGGALQGLMGMLPATLTGPEQDQTGPQKPQT